MADEPNLNELEKPAGAPGPGTAKSDDAEIHVIPDEFYGAPAKHRPASIPVPKPATPSGGGAPPKTPPTEPAPQKAKSNLPIVIIVVVLVLLLGGGAAYYFLVYSQTSECGDGTCQSSESFESCPADCEPPPPVCGDGTCEKPENNFSCPDDCEPEGPACGDDSCDVGENYESCPADCEAPPIECGDGVCEDERGETYAECPDDCEPPPPEQAEDTDSDGLTDAEETEIFGSDPNSTNSDGDSFVDLNEVLNLFDPSRPDPAMLADNPGITTYRNTDYGLELLRPAAWTVQEIPSERSVRFTSATGESIRVAIYRKSPQESLSNWLPNAPIQGVANLERFEQLTNKKGYEQIITLDRRSIFVANDGLVVSFTYDLGGQTDIRYRVTLSVMANSLEFVGEPTAVIEEGGTESPALPVAGGNETTGEEAGDDNTADELPPEEEG